MKEQKRILFTGIIAIILFLNLTGFISHLTGDYYPQLALDNSGLYYDAFYVHRSDILAIVWLSNNNVNHDPIVSDVSGANKFLTYGKIKALDENLPALIPKNAYVYLEDSSNGIVSIENNMIYYNSDKAFLVNHKDTIYSNGEDNIYK